MWFSNSLIPSTFIYRNSSVRETFSFSLICLFIQSFIYISKDLVILFHSLGYNPNYDYLFCCSNYSSFGHWELFWLASVSFWHVSILAPQDDPGSSCIFPALESITSPRSTDSFYWKQVIRNQDLGTRCDHCYWGITASRCSRQTELGNIYMYTNPHILTHLYLFLHVFDRDFSKQELILITCIF